MIPQRVELLLHLDDVHTIVIVVVVGYDVQLTVVVVVSHEKEHGIVKKTVLCPAFNTFPHTAFKHPLTTQYIPAPLCFLDTPPPLQANS